MAYSGDLTLILPRSTGRELFFGGNGTDKVS